MTDFEITILVFESASLLEGTFETWIAMTFAIIVVAHTSGSTLNVTLKLLLAFLYLVTATLLYLRYSDIAAQLAHFASLLPEHGGSPDIETVKLSSFLRKVVFVVGTFGSVIFLFVSKLNMQRKPSEK